MWEKSRVKEARTKGNCLVGVQYPEMGTSTDKHTYEKGDEDTREKRVSANDQSRE